MTIDCLIFNKAPQGEKRNAIDFFRENGKILYISTHFSKKIMQIRQIKEATQPKSLKNAALQQFFADHKNDDDKVILFTEFLKLVDIINKEDLRFLDSNILRLIALHRISPITEKIYFAFCTDAAKTPAGPLAGMDKIKKLLLANNGILKGVGSKIDKKMSNGNFLEMVLKDITTKRATTEVIKGQQEKKNPISLLIDYYYDFLNFLILRATHSKNFKETCDELLKYDFTIFFGKLSEMAVALLISKTLKLSLKYEDLFKQENLRSFIAPFRFNYQVADQKLNSSSELDAIVQAVIDTYYDYLYSSDIISPLKRDKYGVIYVGSIINNFNLMLSLYEKYAPYLLYKKDHLLTKNEIKLLTLALVYVHSANQSDDIAHFTQAVENFKRDMIKLGFKGKAVNKIAASLSILINPEKKRKNAYEYLLHDAYFLDNTRIRKPFDKKNLFIVDKLQKAGLREPLADLDPFIETRQTLYDQLDGRSQEILAETDASKALNLLYKTELDLLVQYVILACFKKGKQVNYKMVSEKIVSMVGAPPNVNYLIFYNHKCREIQGFITEISATDDKKQPKDDPLIGAHLIRVLLNPRVELKQLKKNQQILQKENLTSAAAIKSYVNKKKKTPPKFKWRPCTLISQGLPIQPFSDGMAVIISPDEKMGTYAPYLYKKNVISALTAYVDEFKYENNEPSKKNKGTINGLKSKFEEIEKRRQGIAEDKGLHYFGLPRLDHNEVLASYEKRGIVGIIIGKSKVTAQQAIIFASQFSSPPPFYHYDIDNGSLQPCSRSQVLSQLGSEETTKEEKTTKKIKLPELTKITCPAKETEPFVPSSKDAPLKFLFSHPEYKQECVAYVKNGRPVIEYEGEDKKTITENTELLPAIAFIYYKQKTVELNHLIAQDPAIKALLATCAISELSFDLSPDGGKRNKLIISFKLGRLSSPVDQNRLLKIAQAFFDLLLPLKSGPFKVKSLPVQDNKKICFLQSDFTDLPLYPSYIKKSAKPFETIGIKDFNRIIYQYRSSSRLAHCRFFSRNRSLTIRNLKRLNSFKTGTILLPDNGGPTPIENINALKKKYANETKPILFKHKNKIYLFYKESVLDEKTNLREKKEEIIELDIPEKIQRTMNFSTSLRFYDSADLHPELISRMTQEDRNFCEKEKISYEEIAEASTYSRWRLFSGDKKPDGNNTGTDKAVLQLKEYFDLKNCKKPAM